MRYICKLSYRRVKQVLDLLGIICPSKSALQYTAYRMPKWIWDRALQITAGAKHHIIAIDGTGFSRTNPSYYYLKRIDGKMPAVPVKLSATLDTKNKRWCSAKISVLPRHDVRDARTLLGRLQANILVADKAYDANWLHAMCNQHNIKTHIPLRRYGKPRNKNWTARRKAALHFRKRTYNRRVMVEAGFSSIKRKFGTSVSSKLVKTIRADIYGRLLAHNLFGIFKEI